MITKRCTGGRIDRPDCGGPLARWVRTRAADADAARRSAHCGPGGRCAIRARRRTYCFRRGLCRTGRRDRSDHLSRVAERRRRPTASHDRRAAGCGAPVAARPRSTSRPGRCCTSSSRRSSGSIPAERKPARHSAPRPPMSAGSWTTLPARGLGFPMKTAQSTDHGSDLGGVGDSAHPRPEHQRSGRRRRWLLHHASDSQVRLQVTADRPASKHIAATASAERRAGTVPVIALRPSTARRCAPLARGRAGQIWPKDLSVLVWLSLAQPAFRLLSRSGEELA